MASNSKDKPVRNKGVPYKDVPYRAGGKQQGTPATRKNELLGAGPGTGFTPGHDGTGPRSSARSGYVEESPRESSRGPMEFGVARPAERPRPMPKDIPVQSTTTHQGNIVRFLDGHSEIRRERGYLTGLLNNPEIHPDDKRDIQMEITHRDAINNHKYW